MLRTTVLRCADSQRATVERRTVQVLDSALRIALSGILHEPKAL
jgi:hypothetical protein